MALSRLVLLSILGITVQAQDSRTIGHESISPARSEEQLDFFRLYTTCDENLNSSSKQNCRPTINDERHCISCHCGAFCGDLPDAENSINIRVATEAFNMTNVHAGHADLASDALRTFALGKPSYVIRGIRKLKTKAAFDDLKQELSDRLLLDSFVILPVVISQEGRQEQSDEIETLSDMKNGFATSLSFLNHSLQRDSIPMVVYQTCNRDIHEQNISMVKFTRPNWLVQQSFWQSILLIPEVSHVLHKIVMEKNSEKEYHHVCFNQPHEDFSPTQLKMMFIVKRFASALKRSPESVNETLSALKLAANDIMPNERKESMELLSMIKNITRMARLDSHVLAEIRVLNATRLYGLAGQLIEFTRKLGQKSALLNDLVDSFVFLEQVDPLSSASCLQNLIFNHVSEYLWVARTRGGLVKHILNTLKSKLDSAETRFSTGGELLAFIEYVLQDRNVTAMNATDANADLESVYYLMEGFLARFRNLTEEHHQNVGFNDRDAILYRKLIYIARNFSFPDKSSNTAIDKILSLLKHVPKKMDKADRNALIEYRNIVEILKEVGKTFDNDIAHDIIGSVDLELLQTTVVLFNTTAEYFSTYTNFLLLKQLTEMLVDAVIATPEYNLPGVQDPFHNIHYYGEYESQHIQPENSTSRIGENIPENYETFNSLFNSSWTHGNDRLNTPVNRSNIWNEMMCPYLSVKVDSDIAMYLSQVTLGSNMDCNSLVLDALKRVDFQSVMARIESDLCHGSMPEEDTREEKAWKINKTLSFMKEISNSTERNRTFGIMLKGLHMNASMAPKEHIEFAQHLVQKMTEFHGTLDSARQTDAAEEITDIITNSDIDFLTWNLNHLFDIENLLHYIHDIAPRHNQLKLLCRVAKKRTLLKTEEMSFADVVEAKNLSSNISEILEGNLTETVTEFREFLKKSNLTVQGSGTTEYLANLVRKTGLKFTEFMDGNMTTLHENLTKIVRHFPRLNSTNNESCLRHLKSNASSFESHSVYTQQIKSCVRDIFKPFLTRESPLEYLKYTFKALETSLFHSSEFAYMVSSTIESIVPSFIDTSTYKVDTANKCYPQQMKGLLTAGDASQISAKPSNFPVSMKLSPGFYNAQLDAGKLYYGFLLINTPADFDYDYIFQNPAIVVQKNATLVEEVDIPFQPGDGVPEQYVVTDQKGEIAVKDTFIGGEEVEIWEARIREGRWIVKDDVSESSRRKRQLSDDVSVAEIMGYLEVDGYNHCGEIEEEGWRCLRSRDTFSPEALLKLLHTVANGGIEIGVIAYYPKSEGIRKARNLIFTSISDEIVNSPTSGINLPTIRKVKIAAAKDTIITVSELTKATIPWDNLGWYFSEIHGKSVFVQEVFQRIQNKIRMPDFFVHGSSEREVDIGYRRNSSDRWEKVHPDVRFPFLPAAQIRFGVRLNSTDNIFKFNISLHSGGTVEIVLEVYSPPPVLQILKTQDLKLPPIPFQITENAGFKVSEIVKKLLATTQSSNYVIGVAVEDFPETALGTWQIRCNNCRDWIPIVNYKASKQEVEGLTNNQANLTCPLEYVTLLAPSTRVRFQPRAQNTFWKAAEAWKESATSLSLYRIVKNVTETENIERELLTMGYATAVGFYFHNEFCHDTDVLDFATILTPEKFKFVIERLGCDNRPSSTRTQLDKCGVCGGNGDTCVDCKGVVNGTAYLDKCRRCVGGKTGKKTVLDCANNCDNTSYIDECDFCQRRYGKKVDVRDCAGECFGTASIDKCGACRTRDGTLLHLPEGAEIRDTCGKCGGDNSSCAGCDGVPHSGTTLDRCDNCKRKDDPTYNKGCGSFFYISHVTPAVIVVERAEATSYLSIGGYFSEHSQVSCFLRHPGTGSVVELGMIGVIALKSKLSDAVHALPRAAIKNSKILPDGTSFMRWNLSCESGSDSTSFAMPIYVRAITPWRLVSIQPDYLLVNGGGGDVVIEGESFPQGMDLLCVALYVATDSLFESGLQETVAKQSFLATTRIYKIDARRIDASRVECTFPNSSRPVISSIYVLPKREVESSSPTTIAKSVKGGLSFEYRKRAPSVREARISDDLSFVTVKFDSEVALVNGKAKLTTEQLCKNMLKDSRFLGDGPQCFLHGSRAVLYIRPGKFAVMAIGHGMNLPKITLKGGVVRGREATEPIPEIEVNVQPPLKEMEPKVYFRLPEEVEPCDSILMDVGVSGAGSWDFSYHWSADGFGSNNGAVAEILKKASNGKRKAVIKFNQDPCMMEPGGSYNISVHATNSINKTGPTVTAMIRVKAENSDLRVYVVGSYQRVIKSASFLNLKAFAKFIKTSRNGEMSNESLSAESADDMRIDYSWEAYESNGEIVALEDTRDRKLSLGRGALPPGSYKFIVTAMYTNDQHTKTATSSVTVIVEQSPIVAKISGPKSRMITTDKTMVVDGSRSQDPYGGELTHTWTCEEFMTGAPCSVKRDNGSSMERADAAFTRYQEGSVLVFPSNKFTPGLLVNVTLTVQSENRSASDSINVFLQDSEYHLPSISFASAKDLLQDFIPPSKIARMTAIVLGNKDKNWTMFLKWTCIDDEGFSFVDLTSASLTDIEQTKEIKAGRPAYFSLVLKKYALQPESSYKFRLQATPDPEIHPDGEDTEEQPIVYADIQIKTSPMATGGSIQYSPSNGTSLTEEFTLSGVDWIGSDTGETIFYRFAYLDPSKASNGRRGLTYLGPFSDRSEITTVLPSGMEDEDHNLSVVVFVRLGDDDETVETERAFIPVFPVEIEDEVIDDIKSKAVEALVSGNRDETVKNLLLLQGVTLSGDARLEIKNIADATVEKMDEFDPETKREAVDALDDARNLLRSFEGNVSLSDKSKRVGLKLVDVTLEKLYQKEATSRRKRSTDEERDAVTMDMAEKMLEMFDTVLLSSGSSDELLEETRSKFEEDSEFIMSSFCTSIGFDEPSISADTGTTLISAVKETMPHEAPFPHADQLYHLNGSIQSLYSDWDCDSSSTACQGACLSFGSYELNAINPDYSASDPYGQILTPISAFFVRNPTDGSEVLDSDAGTGNKLTIEYRNLTITPGTDSNSVECRHRASSNVWTASSCSSDVDISASTVTCTCSVYQGYFAVFLQTETSTTDANDQSPETTATANPTTRTSTPDKPSPNGMGVGAVIGLTIALVAVTVVLLLLVKYYHGKASTQRKVTPTNSLVRMHTPPPSYDSSEKEPAAKSVLNIAYEMEPSTPPLYTKSPLGEPLVEDSV